MAKFSNAALAANIRVSRARSDMTQGALATAIGVNVGTIVQYENGSMIPGSDKIFAIAEATGCTPNDLLGWRNARKAG